MLPGLPVTWQCTNMCYFMTVYHLYVYTTSNENYVRGVLPPEGDMGDWSTPLGLQGNEQRLYVGECKNLDYMF